MKLYSKILLGAIIISPIFLTNTIKADTIQTNNIKVSAVTSNVSTKEKEAKSIVGKRFYVNSQNYFYNKTEQDVLNKVVPDTYLELGRYLNIVDSKIINNQVYYQISYSNKENSLGWISSSNDFLFVSNDSLRLVQKFDVNKSYFTLTEDAFYIKDIIINKSNKYDSTNIMEKGTNLNILEQYEINTENDEINWYKLNLTKEFSTKEEAQAFIQSSKVEITEKKKSDKIVYSVTIDGWVNQKQIKMLEYDNKTNSGEITLNSGEINVKSEPKLESESIFTFYESKDTLPISELTTENVKNTKELWYKVQKIGVDNKPTGEILFIKSSQFKETKYTEITKKEDLEKQQLAKLKNDLTTLQNPTGSKDNKEMNKVSKETYVYISQKITASNNGVITNWYHIVDSENKDLGLVKDSDLELIEGNTIKYTLKATDTLESVLDTFKITKEEFKNMNIKLAYVDDVEFKEGLEVIVKAPEISYNTSDVDGTKSGIQLVKDIMYTAPLIKESGLKPSVAYAQAILESGGGTSSLSTESNNLFGIKGTYKGHGSSWATNEDDGSGSLYTINATFRSYPNKMVSVLDYVDLITQNARYSKALNRDTAEETIQAIWSGGYATDTSYVSKVMTVINNYNLTQFD